MKLRLTTVLDLRLAAEDAARREVGRLERERAELSAVRSEHERELHGAGNANVPTGMREVLAAYILAMRSAIADDDIRLAEQDGRIASARAALADAHRAVKAIEAIRARDAQQALRLAARREGRANDEHAARIRMEVPA